MRLITSFVYDKDVFHSFEEKFSVSETGIYAIEITASAKSWWQNTVGRRSFLLKDSLTARLDNRNVIFSPKKKKARADDLWNGNVLKGGELVVYVFAYLEAKHTLSFDVHGKPFVKSVLVRQLEKHNIESRMGYFESRGYPLYPDVRKNTIKLWSIGLLLALTLLGGGLGVYAYENNGYFWLSFDETKEEGADYVLVLNEIRGIITRKTPIAVRYSNGQNFYDIKKSDDVTFHGHDLNYDNEPEIVITGRSKYALTVYVLQNVNGEWIIIPRIGDPHGSQYSAPAFYGHDVNFANTDGEGWREAKESSYISHTDARGAVRGEVRHKWYRYDPKIRAFVFMEQNIETVKNGIDPWEETFGDSIMIEKSPNFIW